MAKTNKAKKLLGIALAAYKRGAIEAAKDIFALAAEEKDAAEIMGDDSLVAPPNPDELKAKVAKALQDGDLDTAQSAIDELKSCGDQPMQAEEEVEVDEEQVESDSDEDVEVDEEVVESDSDEDEDKELDNVEVARLVDLSRQISTAGHKDLAKRIMMELVK